jgi:hypothetical protein
VQNDGLAVSTFRSAQVLYVSRAGEVRSMLGFDGGNDPFIAAAAWRLVPGPHGDAALVHQTAETARPGASNATQYYAPPPPRPLDGFDQSDDCGGAVVDQTIEILGDANVGLLRRLPHIPQAVLPVDVAFAPSGVEIAIAAAGNAYTSARATVYLTPALDDSKCAQPTPVTVPPGEAIALAYAGDELLVQIRDPAVLQLVHAGVTIPLSDVRRTDTGHAIFHANSGHGVACASCHLEGGEDGVTWSLPSGMRRTPALRGTLANTAPYHWQGEFRDLDMLFADVMTARMGGPPLATGESRALSSWLTHIPAPAPLVTQDQDAVARGRALFESASVGCASCHAGPAFTNNLTVDVGTGGAFQVPSLVGLGWRAPYLHDGSIGTLAARFQRPPARHGNTSALDATDLADLVAYLETL